PRQIIPYAVNWKSRLESKQLVIVCAADFGEHLETLRRMRGNLAFDLLGRKAHARAGILQNVAELRAVQLRIDQNSRRSRVPDRVHRLEVFGAILGDDGDAITRIDSEALP